MKTSLAKNTGRSYLIWMYEHLIYFWCRGGFHPVKTSIRAKAKPTPDYPNGVVGGEVGSAGKNRVG